MDIITATKERILSLCEDKNITVKELSHISGVSQSTIKRILNCKSKNLGWVTIKKLCDAFGITLSEFYSTEIFTNLE